MLYFYARSNPRRQKRDGNNFVSESLQLVGLHIHKQQTHAHAWYTITVGDSLQLPSRYSIKRALPSIQTRSSSGDGFILKWILSSFGCVICYSDQSNVHVFCSLIKRGFQNLSIKIDCKFFLQPTLRTYKGRQKSLNKVRIKLQGIIGKMQNISVLISRRIQCRKILFPRIKKSKRFERNKKRS